MLDVCKNSNVRIAGRAARQSRVRRGGEPLELRPMQLVRHDLRAAAAADLRHVLVDEGEDGRAAHHEPIDRLVDGAVELDAAGGEDDEGGPVKAVAREGEADETCAPVRVNKGEGYDQG